MKRNKRVRRRMTLFGMLKAGDGSIWADIGETETGKCEVCYSAQAFIWECINGRWAGARVVACCKSHAQIAIDAFTHSAKITK